MNSRHLFLAVALAAVAAAGCDSDRCAGLTECGGTCADLATSPSHCGACGNACGDGWVCVAAECVPLGCVDECPAAGVFGCAAPPDNGNVVCADFGDGDECLEWGGFNPCDADETCVDGACVGGCHDECSVDGDRHCDGNGFRACGDHDGDGCLELGDLVECDPSQTCSNGECTGECEDECDEGETDCHDGGIRSCGEHDGDACRDWSPVDPCPEGEVCDDDACRSDSCTDEDDDCVCGDDECCEGHCCPVFYICVSFSPDEDFCPFGPGPHAP